MLRKTKKEAVKSKQKSRRRQNPIENPLQREQRHAVLEQLREMVGCQQGCGQFEIVQVSTLAQKIKRLNFANLSVSSTTLGS